MSKRKRDSNVEASRDTIAGSSIRQPKFQAVPAKSSGSRSSESSEVATRDDLLGLWGGTPSAASGPEPSFR